MTDTLLVLGQSYPAANTLTTLYTVPGATSAVVSSIAVCNQGAGLTTFRISVAPAGAADTASQYLYHDVSITNGDTFIATIGITLAATDVVRVQCANGNCSFIAWGVQVT